MTNRFVLQRLAATTAVALFTVSTAVAAAQTLASTELAGALRQGGYVLLMRHASSPRAVPTRETANPDNTKLERQLDDAGRSSATAMGQALRTLKIPIARVISSPTYRAMETAKYAQLTNPAPAPELGDGGQSMQAGTDGQAAWLRTTVAQAPAGSNLFLVTHTPNIAGVFPDWGSTMADGEVAVLRPDGKGGTTLVGRIKIDEWPRLR